MKTITIAIIVAILVAWTPRSGAQTNAPAVTPQGLTIVEIGACILITVVVASAVFTACNRPTWRCTGSPDMPGTNWCSILTREDAAKFGLIQTGQSYRTKAACLKVCSTNTPRSDVSEPLLVMFKSTDLQTWTAVGLMEPNSNGDLTWTDPEPMSAMCFYRMDVMREERETLVTK